MSGGQDEASEYIKTGGVNVFKKTETTGQPAGELREWWLELKRDDDSCWAWCNEKFALSSADEDDEIIHVREVPSPERVREALDVFATGSEWPNWELLANQNHRLSNRVLTLLRSLGIDVEGL